MHLLVADDALPEGHRSGIYLAVCGAMLHPSNLPSACCPEGCDCDLALYLSLIHISEPTRPY